jgi:hypothetical protein
MILDRMRNGIERDKTPGHHHHHHHHEVTDDDDDEQDEDNDEGDDFGVFNPDELPTLLESAKIVFTSFAWRWVGRLACEEEENGGVWS